MWLATDRGFFSVVKIDPAKLPPLDDDLVKRFGGGDLFFVRARVRGDLERACEVLEIDPDLILFWSKADYPYRVIVDRGDLAVLVTATVADLDYTNFKNHIKDREDQKWRVGIYMSLWGVLKRLEEHDWPELKSTNQGYLWPDGGGLLDDEDEPPTYQCRACEAHMTATDADGNCPHCGCGDVEPTEEPPTATDDAIQDWQLTDLDDPAQPTGDPTADDGAGTPDLWMNDFKDEVDDPNDPFYVNEEGVKP